MSLAHSTGNMWVDCMAFFHEHNVMDGCAQNLLAQDLLCALDLAYACLGLAWIQSHVKM